MESYGFDNVKLQPVMVPHWTRGDVEQATVTSTPKPIALKIIGLGNSVGTPKEGVEAGVVEVQGLDEVKRLGAAVRGKIVFYNRPMDPKRKNTFAAYGQAARSTHRRAFGGCQTGRGGGAGAIYDHLAGRQLSAHRHAQLRKRRRHDSGSGPEHA